VLFDSKRSASLKQIRRFELRDARFDVCFSPLEPLTWMFRGSSNVARNPFYFIGKGGRSV